MVSLPTGSNKLLEINTEEVNIVIKSKKNWQGITLDQSSSIVINGHHIKKINSEAAGISELGDPLLENATYRVTLVPIFFEQTDYEIVIRSVSGQEVSFWNENYTIREKISPIFDGDNTAISGVINYDNQAGYSDLEIRVDGKRHLTIRIEVFPTKISYKEDYQMMVNDISEMISEAVMDFLQKTYETFSVGDANSIVLAVYFQILRAVFDNYLKAANKIISVPHHKLMTEHVVLPQHKIKKTDRATEKWLMKHQEYVRYADGKIQAEKALGVKKQITYDTTENRFVKFILKSTVEKLEEFLIRYQKPGFKTEEKVIADANEMIKEVRNIINNTFLHEVTEYSVAQSMSLVFVMAPGYRELYKHYILLQRSLSINGDFFNLSMKDTAQLYEYWCFVKLFSLLKKEYKLKTPDIIKVDTSGITVTLKQGKTSKARFVNSNTDEDIWLFYNPTETKTQTVNQRPDNVLELEKRGTEVSYKYVFDAKYRIEGNTDSSFYPDNKPGPKVDDINTMHRYRDSIVYENKKSKFTFEKTMFGAYILFPYDDWKGYSEGEHIINGESEPVKGHRFYRSIDSVNIGGLPFLPGSTELVERLLSDLINDSKESAFERTTLPRGIEEKLAKVNWDKRDVLLGVCRSYDQFEICKDKKFYYTPTRNIPDSKLPIHYVALYETNEMYRKAKMNQQGQIRYFGEAVLVEQVKRTSITEVPMTRKNLDDWYYRITVKGWKDITKLNESHIPIRPKESGFITDFTNMFLLEHSEFVPELLIKSEEEYRLYSELKRSAKTAEVEGSDAFVKFSAQGCQFSFSDGEIYVTRKEDGKIIAQTTVSEFGRMPSRTFRLMQYAMEKKELIYVKK